MKQRGYTVRLEANRVIVEHRASFRPRTILILAVAYFCYCLLPGIRKTLADLYHSPDQVVGGFALIVLLIPFISGATWLFFASGEVLRCDAQELHFARRKTWGRWHRLRFPATQVRELRQAFRGGPKRRSFTVLTFQYEGKTFDILEDISSIDSNQILNACKSLGLDAIITVDQGAVMLHDIEERGWFINPLKPDREIK